MALMVYIGLRSVYMLCIEYHTCTMSCLGYTHLFQQHSSPMNLLTCSQMEQNPKSSSLSSSKVSPSKGLNGFAVRWTVVEQEDTEKAATKHICSIEFSHFAALSNSSWYSRSSVSLCSMDSGSLKFTYEKQEAKIMLFIRFQHMK